MNVTSIGKFLRKLRIDNCEILKDMADKLNVSSAFLSAVENGKKKMPHKWKEELSVLYSLTAIQIEELENAIVDTNSLLTINLNSATPDNKMLAISFAREFDSIDEETSKKIMELLNKIKGE